MATKIIKYKDIIPCLSVKCFSLMDRDTVGENNFSLIYSNLQQSNKFFLALQLIFIMTVKLIVPGNL